MIDDRNSLSRVWSTTIGMPLPKRLHIWLHMAWRRGSCALFRLHRWKHVMVIAGSIHYPGPPNAEAWRHTHDNCVRCWTLRPARREA